ncbi:MAG: hypothetical protein JKY65_15575 [Planctomycetes bacterium]|nr:hypothetical protein [Planctomycetota bacterium]
MTMTVLALEPTAPTGTYALPEKNRYVVNGHEVYASSLTALRHLLGNLERSWARPARLRGKLRRVNEKFELGRESLIDSLRLFFFPPHPGLQLSVHRTPRDAEDLVSALVVLAEELFLAGVPEANRG